MRFIMFGFAAIVCCMICGLNPAIAVSKLVFGKDIRNYGSKNPGFTNFKRIFGGKWAYAVMFLDILKTVLPLILIGYLFEKHDVEREFTVAWCGLFGVLGHVFPVWYKFKGGKGFLVCISMIWCVSPISGLCSTLVMITVLLTTGYMSLADVCAVISAPLFMLLFGIGSYSLLLVCMGSALVVIRHKDNIKRLINGKESKII
ncbi:MAG: glycerol-3-phosphate acyltransferase [Clostridia bacterium]|nr:glycerol-3-phosphate acyltransferase [Clostridia bacterium]